MIGTVSGQYINPCAIRQFQIYKAKEINTNIGDWLDARVVPWGIDHLQKMLGLFQILNDACLRVACFFHDGGKDFEELRVPFLVEPDASIQLRRQ